MLLMDTVLSPTSILIIETLEKQNGLSKEELKQEKDVDTDTFNYSLDKFIEENIIEEKDNRLFITKSGYKLASEVKKVL